MKQSRIPNCIGLMPNAVHIGSKIGVKIRIAGVTSINVPTTSNSTFIKRRSSSILIDHLMMPLNVVKPEK